MNQQLLGTLEMTSKLVVPPYVVIQPLMGFTNMTVVVHHQTY